MAIYLGPLLPAASSNLPARFGRTARHAAWFCSRWGLPCQPSHLGRGGLLHHLCTLTQKRAVCFLWHYPASHPGWPLATTVSCGVRTFLDNVAAIQPSSPPLKSTRVGRMLVLLPPSEGKTLPASTVNFDADAIAPFSTQLADARQSVLDCLIETSARRDALEILKVGKTIADEVEANKHLRSAQAGPAWQVYSGVLYEAGRFGEIGAGYKANSNFEIWVQSALLGVVDLASPIPPYRLSMDTKLPGLGNLAPGGRNTSSPSWNSTPTIA